ncbi:hypothetical protein QBC47DRAFT_390744 [Echria macrotheca]|uniref:Uncharacterized protein n=1 Tax=Echria macrotheca TaxID=438768 RepID=A0AAJ0B4S6_9PEZI|nr:hypothetical protein QBC47DRAFT_390744 [Echria macrotheca]
MRFAAATVVAGAALAAATWSEDADKTIYSTNYVTVTSCGPTVTNCPADSTVVSSTVVPWTTSTVYSTTTYTVSACPDTVTHCPLDKVTVVTETIPVSTTVCPVSEATATPTGGHGGPWPSKNATASWGSWPSKSAGGGSSIPWPSQSLTSVAPACPTYSVKTISTAITTVIPTVIYETVAVPCPTVPAVPSAGWPKTNGTIPKPPPSTVTAGAASLGGSMVLAAAAGLAAVILA